MVDHLTELTAAQRDRLPVFRDEWVASARSTTPLSETEWQDWESGMRGFYADAAHDWPGVVVRVGSPLIGALAAPVAVRVLRGRRRPPQRRGIPDPAAIGTAVDAVIDAMLAPWFEAPYRENAETGVGPGLRVAVAAAASAAVCAALSTAPTPCRLPQTSGRRSAWVKPRKLALPEPRELRTAVDRKLYLEVFYELSPTMYHEIILPLELPVELAIARSMPVGWGRAPLEYSYSWPIVSAFFRDEMKVPLPEGLWQRGRDYQNALLTRWWWPTRNFIMVCDRPTELHLDSGDRLHNDSGPAIQWADGWGLCYWRGTQVPADLIEPGWTPMRILQEPNTEIRRCAIEHLGWDHFVAAAELTELDQSPDPGNPGQLLRLYDVPGRGSHNRMRVLLCTNATAERSGDRHSFGLAVPADCPTALAAAAWSFDLTEAEYRKLSRAT
jgi:hypothetical protein